MADTTATNPPNPQVESSASTQVSSVSTAQLLNANPALGKEYLDYQKQQQAAIIASNIKDYTATWGTPPDDFDLRLIEAKAEVQAKTDANAKYKDQIIAAGAGTVTQTGTPPPSNPDPAVSSTTNPQVPAPATPAPTAESVVNQTNPVAADPVDYGDFMGGNGAEPEFVDYGQELGNGDPGVSNFYGDSDPLGSFIGNLQKTPAPGTGSSSGFAKFFGDTVGSTVGIQNAITPIQSEAAKAAAAAQNAKQQAIINAQRKQANDGDWRVRLRLAPNANYLYKALGPNGTPNPGILQPLAVTDGVIFPYTPTITTQYSAKYNSYELTHSNYKGYFYQGSSVGDITLNATFTAQDTSEANYLLAVIHFFRSVTKMFYGQDDASMRGAPPPLVFLQGLGEFQFNLHPCVVANFNYTLPNDVDYIRANSVNFDGTNLLQRRDRQNIPAGNLSSTELRLSNAGLPKGGLSTPPAPPTLGTNSPTYVPTKMEIQLTLLPMQTRSQVSQQFSLKQFANGDLIKGGFW